MKGVSRVYLILVVVIFCTSVLELTGAFSTTNYKLEHETFIDGDITKRTIEEFQPTRLSSNRNELLHILVQPNGYNINAVIELRVGASSSLFYSFDGDVNPIKCRASEKESEHVCAIPIKFSSKTDSRVVLFADQIDTQINKLNIKEYQAKRASQLSGIIIFYFFFALAFFGFLFPLLHNKTVKIVLISNIGVRVSILLLAKVNSES